MKPQSVFETLQTILNGKGRFADLASIIGTASRAGQTERLLKWFSAQFRELLEVAPERLNVDRVFKVILGLNLAVGCENSEGRQKKFLSKYILEDLKRLMAKNSPNDRPRERIIEYFLLCELTYLDQHLVSIALRDFLYSQIEPYFKSFAANHVFMDYTAGWKLLHAIHRIIDREKHGSKPKDFQVILVSSVKGGVGKSVAAIALARLIGDVEKRGKVALIDLDSSGPTLQYNLDIPAVATALGTNPERTFLPGRRWPYPTFLDLLTDPTDTRFAPADPSKPLLPVPGFGRLKSLSAVTLPDSPTVTGMYVTSKYYNTYDRADILENLEALLKAIKSKGNKYAILDLGPGLFGTNGAFFSWLNERFWTSIILMSSPRAYDIASSIYEGVWLAAKDYMNWDRPVLQLLNFWPKGNGGIQKQLGQYADRSISAVLARDYPEAGKVDAGKAGSLTSASYILFWRIRAYLYAIAADEGMKRDGRLMIEPLRHDEVIRTLLHVENLQTAGPPELARFGPHRVNMDNLSHSKWYEEDFAPTLTRWLNLGRN